MAVAEKQRKRGARIYPWADWFAAGRFRLRRGQDYYCSTGAMASQVRYAAWKRRVGVRIEADDGWLEVRVHPLKEKASA